MCIILLLTNMRFFFFLHKLHTDMTIHSVTQYEGDSSGTVYNFPDWIDSTVAPPACVPTSSSSSQTRLSVQALVVSPPLVTLPTSTGTAPGRQRKSLTKARSDLIQQLQQHAFTGDSDFTITPFSFNMHIFFLLLNRLGSRFGFHIGKKTIRIHLNQVKNPQMSLLNMWSTMGL